MKTKIVLGLSALCLLASVACKKKETPIVKKTQKLTITTLNTLAMKTTTEAKASSDAGTAGGRISYSILPTTSTGAGSATIDAKSNIITPISVGTVILKASTAGNAQYETSSASITITIGKAPDASVALTTPTITFVISAGAVVGTAFTFNTATPSIGSGSVVYTVTENASGITDSQGQSLAQSAVLTGNTFTPTKAGTIKITATLPAHGIYASATPVEQIITVSKVDATLAFTAPTNGGVLGVATGGVCYFRNTAHQALTLAANVSPGMINNVPLATVVYSIRGIHTKVFSNDITKQASSYRWLASHIFRKYATISPGGTVTIFSANVGGAKAEADNRVTQIKLLSGDRVKVTAETAETATHKAAVKEYVIHIR